MTGRLVDVRTSFYTEGVKPGGIDRGGAVSAAAIVIEDAQAKIATLVLNSKAAVVRQLNDWSQSAGPEKALAILPEAGTLRDIAGLAGNTLLSEVAALASDALDLVAYEDKTMRVEEATILAHALTLAGTTNGAEGGAVLLRDLKRLVGKIASRVE